MFIGHFAVAFAAKRAAPAMSLGTLILGCQLADLVWPTLVLAGIERFAIAPGITEVTPLDFQSYPYSHSLVGLGLWAAVLAIAYRLRRPAAAVTAVMLLAAVVLSHWVLDVATHRPDVPVTLGGDAKLGLGLWNSRPATLVVETLMLAAGLAMYIRSTSPIDRVGRWSLVSLVVFLVVVNVANMYGPPPPSVGAVAWTAHSIWLLVAWGYWIDRHRTARGTP